MKKFVINKKITFTSFKLHIFAAIFMFADHLYMIGLSNQECLRYIGRLAFPIFSFMIANGYFYTRNFKKYLLRIIVFAIISEIPYNLIVSGNLFCPVRQNVLWTFSISLISMHLCERINKKYSWICVPLVLILDYIVGTILMVDYYGAGVAMVMIFYIFRKKCWQSYVGQLLSMLLLNLYFVVSESFSFTIFNACFHIPYQVFALISLFFIWNYNGEKGYHSQITKSCFYLFYPIHFLILYIVKYNS